MSQETYMSCANQAVMAFYGGRHREAASKYQEAFEASPSKWADNRWQVFHGYTSILQENYFKPSESDFAFLQKVVDEKAEPKLFRVEAAFTAGLLDWEKGERDESAEFYREAIRLAGKTAEKEKKKKVLASIPTPDGTRAFPGMKQVGEIIQETKQLAEGNLKKMEHAHFGVLPSNQTWPRSDGTQFPAPNRNTQINVGPLQTDLTQEQVQRMLSVGGAKCDCCSKTAQDVGRKVLSNCARCGRAYYCSAACQRKQWKAGHKESCRKPGQIEPGDYVRLNGLVSNPEINGQIVCVLGPDPQKEGRWETRIPGGVKSVSIATEKLELLRPLK